MSETFQLAGVVTCVNFADILAETLPLNLRHFIHDPDEPPHLMIVTSPSDVETQRVCRYYGVPHSQTDAFRAQWGEFHKGRGINNGLRRLEDRGWLNGWVIHFDADIILPPETRSLIKRANLNKGQLYGADRTRGISFDEWRLHQAMPILQQDNYHVHAPYPVAPRFSGGRMGGYAPPGFFQMWWVGPDGHKARYPEGHTNAAREDVLHTSRWWRRDRAILPEFYVYHLESESGPPGMNWGGRRSMHWGPAPDRNAWHHPLQQQPPLQWPPKGQEPKTTAVIPDDKRKPKPPHHHRPPHHEHHHHHHHHPYGPGPCQDQEEEKS